MRKTTLSCMLVTALVSSCSVNAQVFSFSFKDTNSADRSVKPTALTYLNPTGTMTLNLISGLDRYERIKVIRDSDQKVMHSAMTSLVGVADRVTAADGSEYYGKNMALPALGEGGYTILDETLDIHQAVVSSATYKLMLDVTRPAYTSFYPRQDAGYGMVLSGPLWELGRAGAGQFDIFLDGVTDANDIDNVRLVIRRADGSAISDQSMNYDPAKDRAFYTWVNDMVSAKTMPTSDLNETFTFNVFISDKAGNIRTVPPQSFKYDDQLGEVTAFAVHDSRSPTSNVPGISSGYVPYKAGLSVLENPYRVVLRIPRTNWKAYRNGGIDVTNTYGGNSIIASDNTYIYLEAKLPQGALDGNYFRPDNTYQWGGGDLTYVGRELAWDPTSLKSPVWAGKKIERQKGDGTWIDSVNWSLFTAADLPMTFNAIRFTVEARPYAQYITNVTNCNIPAGATSCTVSLSRTLAQNTTGYMHDGFAIKASQEATFNTPMWENITWHALKTTVTGYNYDEKTNLLNAYVNIPGDGSYFDRVKAKKVWLSDKNQADKEILTGTQTSRNVSTGNNTFQFDMKSIPEGSYNLIINAVDTYANAGSLPFRTFIVDRTPPVVNVSYEGKPVDKSVTVMGLENLRINLSDTLTTPKISRIVMRGGPTSDFVELSWASLGNNVYSLNYPRIFPSLNEGETYRLTVTATDEMNNTKDYESEFGYLPNNLVRLDNLRTLAVNASLKTTTDVPLAVLSTGMLRRKDGQLATGVQNAILTVRRDAQYGINLNGTAAAPGESKNLMLDLGLGDPRTFPIYPTESGKTGTSEFIIEIPELSIQK